MAPLLNEALVGLLKSGLTTLIAPVGRRVGRALVGRELLERMERRATGPESTVQEAVDEVSENVDWKGPGRVEEVCLFLASPEAESIVRQIFATKLSTTKTHRHLDLIGTEFAMSLGAFLGLPQETLTGPAGLLLDALLEACDRILKSAIGKGSLSAHEIASTFRHGLLLDELAAIQKNVALLTGRNKPDVRTIIEFKKKYCQQVGERHSFITPPHFDAVRKVPIDDLYVPSSFIKVPKKKGGESEVLPMPAFLSAVYRAVLLGNPGGGKSTFALKLCHDLAAHYGRRLFAGRLATPVLAARV